MVVENKKVSSILEYSSQDLLKHLNEDLKKSFIDRIDTTNKIMKEKKELILFRTGIESSYYNLQEKLDDNESKEYICKEDKDNIDKWIDIANKILFDEPVTFEELKLTYSDLEK